MMDNFLLLLLMNILNLNLALCDEKKEDYYYEKKEEYYDDNNSLLVFVTLGRNKTFEYHQISNRTKMIEANQQNNALNSTIHLVRAGRRLGKVQTPKFRVIGGKPAVLGEVPWQVALKNPIRKTRKKLYKTFCGGSIIGNTKVLTAAHCLGQYIIRNPVCPTGKIRSRILRHIYAVAGTLKTESEKFDEGQWRSLNEAYYPTNYNFPDFDICVLKVRTPFQYDSNVHSVLMQTKYEDMVGECLVSGYGGINSAFSKNLLQSPKLLTGYVKLLPTKDCRRLHSKKYATKFVCTVTGSTDVSKGDSGGPLVCLGPNLPKTEARLVGVTSGTIRSIKASVTFFTRVSAYQDFIASEAYNVKCHILVLAYVFLVIKLYIFF